MRFGNVPNDVILGCALVVNVPVNKVAEIVFETVNTLVAELNVKLELAPKLPLLLYCTCVFDPETGIIVPLFQVNAPEPFVIKK